MPLTYKNCEFHRLQDKNIRKNAINNFRRNFPLHKAAITSFAISLYGQCCRRHVVGQIVVSDVSVVRGR